MLKLFFLQFLYGFGVSKLSKQRKDSSRVSILAFRSILFVFN